VTTNATTAQAPGPDTDLRAGGGKAKWAVLGFFAFLVIWAILALVNGDKFPGGDEFKPQNEFALNTWGPELKVGPFDFSFNKAVLYLFLASAISILVGVFVVRGGLKMRPTKAQNVVEMAYDFAETQIARATLPPKVFNRYFPYIATLFIFIAVSNLISFIPLPSGEHASLFGIPDLALYAATANINVTLALTICTFLIYNYEGVKAHGPVGYLKTFVPGGDLNPIMKGVIFALELLSNILRLVSLSVRLFANMLAGHLLIIMAAGFAVLLASFVGAVAIPFGLFFYFFEWVLIAGLQAFIFAMLSGIYIGFAVESAH
jgi:F-type H+-transporting ATPase subunit a